MTWSLLAVTFAALVAAFYPGLDNMVRTWSEVEEYSYGYFIPVIVGFLIWQRSDRLREIEPRGSWWGVGCVMVSLGLCIVGRLSLARILLQYGFVIAIAGVVLAAFGKAALRLIAVPICMLFLMVPLPHFLLAGLSEQLQLLSSRIGVSLIQACDISVYLEGNVIDLGSYKLQVADACSGLRYLFPLMALGIIAANFFKVSLWKRLFLFASTLPLTVLINSIRIGLIGISVEYWGPTMAEGLLHEFEGWFMFMICMALLVCEMALLARIGPRPTQLRTAFGIDFPTRSAPGVKKAHGGLSRPLRAAVILTTAVAAATLAIPARGDVEPARSSFALYPAVLPGGWVGRSERLETDVLQVLQLDDYLLADYDDGQGTPMNFYVAYYASQTGSEKASHSPRTCIPGGGWSITDLRELQVPMRTGPALDVNRVIIERGEYRDLVYYWFKQRGRTVTSEWAVKWYIFVDSLRMGRSDGALVRLVAQVPRGVPLDTVDQRMQRFLGAAVPTLDSFVPN